MSRRIFNSVVRNKTKILLNEHLKLKSNTIVNLSKATGLSETWIAMFYKDELKHTDIGRVEALYNHLSPVKLEV